MREIHLKANERLIKQAFSKENKKKIQEYNKKRQTRKIENKISIKEILDSLNI